MAVNLKLEIRNRKVVHQMGNVIIQICGGRLLVKFLKRRVHNETVYDEWKKLLLSYNANDRRHRKEAMKRQKLGISCSTCSELNLA